jgi:hypothetical protein
VALKDKIPLGMSLPHRSPDPLAMTTVATVARRAEELGFSDLWVTENTIDRNTCFDPVVILTYAAAITSRIRVGASVVVLPIHSPLMVAHQWATLDFVSGGRAILAGPPLSGLPNSCLRARDAVPGGSRVDQGTLDRRPGHLSRRDVSGRKSHLGHKTGTPASPTALDGRWPSQRHPPSGTDCRRLDGIGRIEHRRFQGIGTNPEAGIGEGRARSSRISGIKTSVHGGRRAAGSGTGRAQSMVHRSLS